MKKNLLNIANILSFSRILFGLIFFWLFYIYKYSHQSEITILILKIISLLVFIIAIITDGLDGYFARKKNKITDFGKHFDPLTDSIFFIIVFFTFLMIKLLPWYFFILILLRELFMHVFLRPYFSSKGLSLPANVFGKIKTVIQAVFSISILTFLAFEQILIILIDSNQKIIEIYNYSLNIFSYIAFVIITFFSLLSIIIYVIKSKNVISNAS